MPPKAAEVDTSATVQVESDFKSHPSQNRQRSQQWSIADELLCPICLELPLDPVIAEDGRIYERCEIQKHINQTGKTIHLKSPVTNKVMGPKLVPCLQIKNIIEKAIENEEIEGDLAENWKSKQSTKKVFDEWLHKAEQGDGEAMVQVAKAFSFGLLGREKDLQKGREWWRKAADADNIWGLTFRAYVLLTTEDTSESIPLRAHGLILLTQAAERGSDLACYLLGMMYADGNELLPQSKKRAAHFLKKGLGESAVSIVCPPTEICTESHKCNVCLFCDIKRKEAKEYLKQLVDEV
ncbi:Sel1 repeat-containing protein [Nitzschia inconspicua]|uniref:Sel1 repeat-containing protein n=1 Tax=Nitzschia inconspicua TaxID=303405 RepID=A0A9K3KXE3_9STRA|nr:Sel1 repeat-containing protein [Nitzschia inconspicua]